MSEEKEVRYRYIVTADPPTPNGDLHVGHLSGPYFAADALTRALRAQGHDVAYYSNFDPHQSYVVTTARNLGWTPEEVVAHFQQRIAETLAADAIEPDVMGSPDDCQKAFVGRFFEDLYARGKLLVRDEEQPYCGRCGLYLFETYIQGTCPHCGTGCYGNGCEVCALPNSPKDMGSPRCRHCGTPPSETRTYRGLFLPLSRTQDELRRYVETRRGIWRPHFFETLLPAFDAPLPDIPLSVVSDYGLPVSIPGFEGQVYNVRLEILPALVNTFDKWRERQGAAGWDWREAPADVRSVHFHGFENAFQYCVSFNTLLLLSDLAWGLPYANLTNEFYLLEGAKFSTTRRHAIWGSDFLAAVTSDQARFYLALTNPETAETNLALDELRRRTDALLSEPWNRLERRLAGLLAERRTGAAAAALDEASGRRIDALAREMAAAFAVEGLSLARAARCLADFLAGLAARADALDPAAGDAPARSASLLAEVRAFALYAEPVMPRLAGRLRRRLEPAPVAGPAWESAHRPVAPRDVRWDGGFELPLLAEADFSGFGLAKN